MTPEDREKVAKFALGLSHEDLVHTRVDIRKSEVIEDWIEGIERGRFISVLAEDKDGEVVGYGTLHNNELTWTRHQGEIRLIVKKELRGIGLGKCLATELVQIAKDQNLQLIVVNIPRDQPHIRKMLERMGFSVEALLTDWLIDIDGNTHDLMVMSHHVRDF
jgi:RimJ/RimL family protein N-acetyltransferase